MAEDEQSGTPNDIEADDNGNLFWVDPDTQTEMQRQPNRPPADPDVPVKDGMHPPTIPEMVHCIHCDEEYDSWRIEWRVLEYPDGTTHGFWCCPIPGCDGKGFGVDIYPVDFPPDGCWKDEDGREIQMVWDDDEEDGEEGDGEIDGWGGDPPDTPGPSEPLDDDLPF